jgi:hypothetical protein
VDVVGKRGMWTGNAEGYDAESGIRSYRRCIILSTRAFSVDWNLKSLRRSRRIQILCQPRSIYTDAVKGTRGVYICSLVRGCYRCYDCLFVRQWAYILRHAGCWGGALYDSLYLCLMVEGGMLDFGLRSKLVGFAWAWMVAEVEWDLSIMHG